MEKLGRRTSSLRTMRERQKLVKISMRYRERWRHISIERRCHTGGLQTRKIERARLAGPVCSFLTQLTFS
jgi:hypothetical protein